jgi:4-hydroxy-3-polyprenylbenzoate decarboxylase
LNSIVVAISGASGAGLGMKFIEKLPKNVKKYVILTDNAKLVLEKEENFEVFNNGEIEACISSGSFKVDGMAVIPTSMNTLAKISVGIADNLTTRVASVMIKENRTLLLAPREMPFSAIALENMHKLSTLGVKIAPPVFGYYSNPKTIEDIENFLIGKWFDLLGIENDLFKRWE